MGKWVLGERVGEIVVGGQPQRIQTRNIVLNGLKGCVEVGPFFINLFIFTYLFLFKKKKDISISFTTLMHTSFYR